MREKKQFEAIPLLSGERKTAVDMTPTDMLAQLSAQLKPNRDIAARREMRSCVVVCRFTVDERRRVGGEPRRNYRRNRVTIMRSQTGQPIQVQRRLAERPP